MSVFYQDPAVQILHGDVMAMLQTLPDNYVQTVVTSPPYWGLRDYNVEGQIGLENTPSEYIAKMVDVFHEVHRVLRKDGTLWLNMGDCYVDGGRGADTGSTLDGTRHNQEESRKACIRETFKGLKPKNMIGMPWRLALALQADGWFLRRDIIWHKENAMPESANDRPTTAHEYLFLLTKRRRYFYDGDAIKEKVTGNAHARGTGVNPKCAGWADGPGAHRTLTHAQAKYGKNHGKFSRMNVDRDPAHLAKSPKRPRQNASFSGAVNELVEFRNKRSVWTINSEPFLEAHFATFPEKLIEPCILAGAPEGGMVLDPFAGASTTLLVAKKLNRKAVGIELNPDYCAIGAKRLRGEPARLL